MNVLAVALGVLLVGSSLVIALTPLVVGRRGRGGRDGS